MLAVAMADALQLGRYSVFAELASGGMATVYLGRMSGAVGFGRTVAIKRLHPHLARDPDFVTMFLDEARLAARVQHPNVVPTLDVVTTDNELFLVLEYVKGETLGGLLRAARHGNIPVPIPITLSILVDLLNGLHAAHEAKDEQGVALDIVHRDVSPQNVIVGADGVARVLDFGVAKAASRLQTTREGQIKGKVSYMAPEQITGQATRRSDVYAAGVVLWEALALRRLFTGDNEAQLLHAVLVPNLEPPSKYNPGVPPELDRIVLRALSTDPELRFATAREMAESLDACMRPASSNQVASWLESMAGPSLQARSQLVAEFESHSGNTGRSEVRKLMDLGAGALLSGESGSYGARKPGAPPSSNPSVSSGLSGLPRGTGSSVTVASVSVQPPAAAGSGSSRSWMLVLGGAVLAGAVGGVIFLVARGSSSPVIQATGETTWTTPVPASASGAPVAPVAPPTGEAAGAAAPSAPAASEAASPASAPGAAAAHAKKPTSPAPPPKPKGTAAAPATAPGDINSLLDSH
jgi:serine/threonine protein kinase